MGQPIPPGDNVPLYEGLDPSWNDVVSAFPEDKRAELAPLLKERVEGIQKAYEPLKQYEQFAQSNVSPDQLQTALKVYSTLENTPDQVYKMLGEYLGVSAKEAKEVVQEVEEGDDDDPRIRTMQQQIDTLMQIKLAEHQQTQAQKQQEEQDKALDREINGLKKKYGDVDEEEILMRMLHKGQTAEQAYQEYTNKVSQLRTSRPAPMIMGQGGQIPRNAIDPVKLDNQGVKSLVAQYLTHANQQRNNP